MDDEFPDFGLHNAKGVFVLAGVVAGGWPILYFIHPMLWAIVTAIILMMAFGMFTAKSILGVGSTWTALGLAPLFGTAWIAVFYGMFRLLDL
jgi:hypothetical protein